MPDFRDSLLRATTKDGNVAQAKSPIAGICSVRRGWEALLTPEGQVSRATTASIIFFRLSGCSSPTCDIIKLSLAVNSLPGRA